MNKRKRELVAILLTIALVVGAFFPSVLNNVTLYNYVKVAVFGLLLFLSLSTAFYKALKHKFVSRFFVITLITGVMLFFFYSIGMRIKWGDLVSILIVCWMMCIGYCSSFEDREIDFLLVFYGILSSLLGIYSMFYYVGSVSLADYMYAVDTKNMVGQLVATSGIGVIIALSFSQRFRWVKLALIGAAIILLFVLRCKTALVAFLLFGVFFLWKAFNSTWIVFFMIVGVFAIIVFYSNIIAFFEVVFVGTKDIMDLNDLSSGRLERNVEGIAFFISNPIFGEMTTPPEVENIHNYILKRMVAYGVFSIPFIVLYFYNLIRLIKEWLGIGARIKELRMTGLLMLMIPFFSSLVEPSAPFGPGLIQLIPFFFYGITLKHVQLQQVNSIRT